MKSYSKKITITNYTRYLIIFDKNNSDFSFCNEHITVSCGLVSVEVARQAVGVSFSSGLILSCFVNAIAFREYQTAI